MEVAQICFNEKSAIINMKDKICLYQTLYLCLLYKMYIVVFILEAFNKSAIYIWKINKQIEQITNLN